MKRYVTEDQEAVGLLVRHAMHVMLSVKPRFDQAQVDSLAATWQVNPEDLATSASMRIFDLIHNEDQEFPVNNEKPNIGWVAKRVLEMTLRYIPDQEIEYQLYRICELLSVITGVGLDEVLKGATKATDIQPVGYNEHMEGDFTFVPSEGNTNE